MSYGSQRGSRFFRSHRANEETNWIGAGSDAPGGTTAQQTPIAVTQRPTPSPPQRERTPSPRGVGLTTGQKSPVELMQDLLKGARGQEESRALYSREAEERLGELLTNRVKLGSYVRRLEGEMVGLDSGVVKNYEVLLLLLEQVSAADVEIRQSREGMEVQFNRGQLQRQEAEIERLEREREEREKQTKFIVEEYESIILNFNEVIEKLLAKEEGRPPATRPRY